MGATYRTRAALVPAATLGMGVVFGDIGTSPLYALGVAVHDRQSILRASAAVGALFAVVLATVATMIASQSIISGAYSLTQLTALLPHYVVRNSCTDELSTALSQAPDRNFHAIDHTFAAA